MAESTMQGGNLVSGTSVKSGGFAILGNNFSAAGNITINAGPSSEKKCLQALFVTSPADDRAKHISFKGEPVRSIFTWITNMETYKSWADRRTGSSLLWISGGPGTGKTMLSIFLSEELEQLAKNNGLVLYYFCEGRDPKRNSPINILRGLIYTLVQQRPLLIKHLLPDYEVQDDALFGSDRIEPLWRVLINMVKDPATGVIYCIIDGIDECATTSLEHLEHILKKFTSFYRSQMTRHMDGDGFTRRMEEMSLLSKGVSSQQMGSGNVPDTSGPAFKVALISREDPQCLPRELSAFRMVQLGNPTQTLISTQQPASAGAKNSKLSVPVPFIPASNSLASSTTNNPSNSLGTDSQRDSGYANSLALYIEAKINDLAGSKGYNENYRNVLKRKIEERGDGTFLWVDMAVAQLSKSVPENSDPDLSILPNGTDGMYCLGILQIPQDMAATAAFVLRWVAVAFRPLKIKELSALVYFVNGQANGPEIEEVRKAVISCGTLLDVSADDEVKLGHQTAKDFLTGPNSPLLADPRIQQFHVNEKNTHAEIAGTSISYIEHAPFNQHWWHLASFGIGTISKRSVEPDPDFLAQYPFVQYSSLFWPDHLNQATPGTANLSSPLFSPGNQIRHHWFKSVWEAIECMDADLMPLYMSLLHIAAYFDLHELAQMLSLREDFKVRINKKNGEFMSPLFVAAARGSARVFTFLLDHGAHRNWGASGEDILQFTSRRGQLGLVKILITRGANVNQFLAESMAIKGAKVAFRYAPKKLINYVIKSGYREDEDINELACVDYGANMSPLQCAVCCGHEEVAKLLLDNGANIQYTTTTGWTAMHFAAWAGQESLIQLIQRYMGNISLLSDGGWSPLHCAAWRGRTSAGGYLIDQGLDTGIYSKGMQTPLHLASFRGHDEMAKTLLSRGANVAARTNKGLTSLHLAAAEGHDKVVQVLLEYGANRESTSNRGEKALKLAKGGRNSTTAQLLMTYWPPTLSHHCLPATSPGVFNHPLISTASNSPPSGFTGHIPEFISGHGYQNFTAGIGNPAYSGPIFNTTLSSTSPGATSTPYTQNFVPNPSSGVSTIQNPSPYGVSPLIQSSAREHYSRAPSLPSLHVPGSPISNGTNLIHGPHAESQFPYSPPQGTWPPPVPNRQSYFAPTTQSFQQSDDTQHAAPPSLEPAGRPSDRQNIMMQHHSTFPTPQRPQFPAMVSMPQPTSLAPQIHVPAFPQQQAPQYNIPSPPSPQPQGHPHHRYLPENFQQPQQYAHQQPSQYVQPSPQQNPQPQFPPTWNPQQAGPPVPQCSHLNFYQQPRQQPEHSATGQSQFFAPPPTTPVEGPNKNGLLKGLLSQFKN